MMKNEKEEGAPLPPFLCVGGSDFLPILQEIETE